MKIEFRKLAVADLPLMHRWLAMPHVAEHYNDHLADLAAVTAHYLPVIEGTDDAYPYLAVIDGTPVGYLQTYAIDDTPAYANALALGTTAAGVDMFIGEVSHVHKGLGAAILTAFVDEIVWERTGCDVCCIGPAIDNPIAIRAYEKAGFVYLKTVEIAGEPVPEYIMVKPRGA